MYTRPYYSDSFYAWKQIPIGALGYLSSYTSLAELASAIGGQLTSISKSESSDLVVGRTYGAGINVQRTNNDGLINVLGASGPNGVKYGFFQISHHGQVSYHNNVDNVESDWNFGCNTLDELSDALDIPKSDDELLVDLGLPSGNLWATRNVDVTRQNGFAASPYQYECSFFSWGNTDGHNPISSSAFSYDWGNANSGTYASTHGSTLTADAGLSDDFGRFNLGGEWRLPTTDDFAELFNSTYTEFIDANGNEVTGTNKLVTVNGVIGIRLRSKVNAKTIFFPCSGYGNETVLANRGVYGFYWSSSLNSASQGRLLSLHSTGVFPQNYVNRFIGCACRPVASKSYKDVYPTLRGLASAMGVPISTTASADNGIRLANISGLNAWLTYLITCDAGSAATYKNCVFLVSFYCGSPKELIIDVIDSSVNQYSILKPDSWATDDTYLYLKRQAGVTFSCLPIGRASADRFMWNAGYPSSPTAVTPTVKYTAQLNNTNSVGNSTTPVYFNGGVATACAFSMWSGTQAQYDAITTKDSNTFYFITES